MPGDFDDVSQLLRDAVHAGCFPGGVLAVGHRGDLVFEAAAGEAALLPKPRVMSIETVFDLASLTKPLVTSTALMLLVDAGIVQLDSPITAYIPTCTAASWTPSPTLRQLLCHCSGLPAWRAYYQAIDPAWPLVERRQAVYAAVHREPLVTAPGVVARYSDLGFILLGELVERLSGLPFERFCRQEIFTPLHLEDLGFLDASAPAPAERPYASTEYCPWRGRILEGEVHDENAWIMGGVAGHAGLFGSARQVWRLAQSLLEGLQGLSWLVSTKIIETFAARQNMPAGSTWGLGWDTPTPGNSSAGRYFASTSIGHLGFTGTSVWIDPTQQVIVVLCTNRVHPSRQRQGIRAFRPLIHDAVMQAVHRSEG